MIIEVSIRRPDPQWHVVVDSWLNIPYPDWYSDYFMSHFDASQNPQAFLGAFAAAMADSGQVRRPLGAILRCQLAHSHVNGHMLP